MSSKVVSPLRYPGGKSAFSAYITAFLQENMLLGGLFVEPYAGGASTSITLLAEGLIERAILAEADPLLYAFWRSVFFHANDLCELIKKTPVSLHTWHELQDYLHGNPIKKYGIKRSALACLYLNRMNFSGILHAKPIGGLGQQSEYKIDCRFNKGRIIELIRILATYQSQVEILNEDALSLIKRMRRELATANCLVYIDPPYYVQGHRLYRYSYSDRNHKMLAEYLSKQGYAWLVSIDDHPKVRDYYNGNNLIVVRAKYTAKHKRHADELLISNRPLLAIDNDDAAAADEPDLANEPKQNWECMPGTEDGGMAFACTAEM